MSSFVETAADIAHQAGSLLRYYFERRVSFEMKGAHPHDVATVIDRQGVAVRAGTHCVMPLLERFNVTATCRASFAMYNTREEVDNLVQALIKARELFS